MGGKVSAVLEVQLGLPADLRPGDAARREAWRKRRQEAQSFLPVFQPPPPPTPPPPPPPPPPVDPPTVVREKTSASAPVLEGALPLDPVEATPPLPAPAQSRDSVHNQQPIIETMIIISLMIIVIRMIGVCLSVRDKTMTKFMMIVIISFFIPISL